MLRMIKLTISTTTTAPIIAGTIANPATIGPQSPNNNPPNHAPTKPAMMLPMIPPGTSRPVKRPANQPMIPPIISAHNKLI